MVEVWAPQTLPICLTFYKREALIQRSENSFLSINISSSSAYGKWEAFSPLTEVISLTQSLFARGDWYYSPHIMLCVEFLAC